jgi:hypothetical protein
MMLLTVVASLATLFLCSTAAAQAIANPKTKAVTTSCKGNAAACVKLDLYQKMAATASGAGASAQGRSASGAAASHNNPATARQGRAAAGGVENNPSEGGGGSVIMKLEKNADRQARLMAKNGRQQAAPRFSAASQGRAQLEVQQRQVVRWRPAD